MEGTTSSPSSSISMPHLPLLNLTIRFSASIPDLPLQIPHPASTNTSALKQLIRSRLPSDLSTHRLRLIYAGHALVDAVPLSTSLKLRTPPTSTPLPKSSSTDSQSKDKGKGKTPIYPSTAPNRDFYQSQSQSQPQLSNETEVDPPPRSFIHCSIGDIVLSTSDLAAEAAVAHPSPSTSTSSTDRKPSHLLPPLHTARSTAEAPLGFARLPLSPTTLTSLRTQFHTYLAHTTAHPLSPTSLLRAEDEWLDNTAPHTTSFDPNNPGGEAGDAGGGGAGPLDDLLWGATMGFFWPVACLWWVGREEGVWSRRRRVAVGLGGLVNLLFGVLRWMG